MKKIAALFSLVLVAGLLSQAAFAEEAKETKKVERKQNFGPANHKKEMAAPAPTSAPVAAPASTTEAAPVKA